MSNNSAMAFLSQQADNTVTAPATTTTPPAAEPPVKQEEVKETKIEPLKKTKEELLGELGGVSGNAELWNLTYMLHDKEHFQLREQQQQDMIRMGFNELCKTQAIASRLESVANCAAAQKNNYTYFSNNYRFTVKNLTTRCKECQDDIAFCPHKMAGYIEYFCQSGGYDAEEIYRAMLGDDFREKPRFAKYEALNIPKEEYDFIDPVSATAAAELIKMKWIDLSSETDDRILYSYLPVCERTKRSFIAPAMDYYRCKSGKNDFIRKNSASSEICENRNCSDCLFPQCPDKVAAYILHLSNKHNVDALVLAEYITTTNKINGVSLRGNFRYYRNLRTLANIPFTPESRTTLNNITKYIVNKYTLSESKVPFLPFHLALYTKDEKLADETASVFTDFLYYYNYFAGGGALKCEEFKFSDGGLKALTEYIQGITKPTVLHIKEFHLLGSDNTNALQNSTMQMTHLANLVEEKKTVFLIVSGEKTKLDTALAQYSDFYQGTLAYHLAISDMPTIKIVGSILSELKEKYVLEEGFEPQLEYYVISKYGESPLKSKAFIDSVVQNILFNHYNKEFNAGGKLLVKDIPMATNRRSDEEIWKELNSLTGLESVKTEVKSIEQLLKFQKKMQNIVSKQAERPNMHMVFTGNPGTGKTTVARLISEILYNVGFIKQNKLVEVSSKDLIGQYIGQTAPKTAAVCESAYGGVLFIDEAYELTVKGSDRNASFRSECISELIKQMEDNRDKLIVIFAGYTKEMLELLQSNAGFASRIGKIIHFEDYSDEQLLDIFVRLVYKNGMRISDAAKATVMQTIQLAKVMPNFGNARYVRNLYENTIMEHAKNTVTVDDADVLMEISAEDIPVI